MQAPPLLGQQPEKSHLTTTLWILTVLVAVLLTCCGLGSFFVLKVLGRNKDASAYARKLILSPAFSKWDADVLLREVSPEFYDNRDPSEVRKLTVQLFQKEEKYYGPLVSTGKPTSFAYTSPTATSGSGRPIDRFDAIAMTNTKVIFQKAKANIYLQLISRGGTWKVAQFRINPIK